MTKVKLVFGDVSCELEGTEDCKDLSDMAFGLLSFLVTERLRFNEMSQEDEEQVDASPPSSNAIPPALPTDVLKAYL
jgi:hypothetical protein